MMGLDFKGRIFEDNFLITDISIRNERPAERSSGSILHSIPVNRRFFASSPMISDGSIPMTVERFVHDRVIFAGDNAHLVSPFGARGCNGGIADAANLDWKLDCILREAAPRSLLESYDEETIATADENILHSTRPTNYLAPRSPASRAMRDAVLELAQDHAFARPFVNSGRLSNSGPLSGQPAEYGKYSRRRLARRRPGLAGHRCTARRRMIDRAVRKRLLADAFRPARTRSGN